MLKKIYYKTAPFLAKKQFWFGLFITQAVILVLFIYGFALITKNNSYKNYLNQGIEGTVLEVQSGDKISQEIPIEESISGLGIQFVTWGTGISDGTVRIELLDETNTTYFETAISATEIKDNQYLRFSFNPTAPKQEAVIYTLCITFEEIDNQKIGLRMSNNLYNEVDFIINDINHTADMVLSAEVSGQYSKFLYSYVICMPSLFVLVFVIFFMVYRFKIKLHYVYLLAGVLLGLVYMTILPVGIVPDETYHMFSAYSVSNTMLGIENDYSNGTISMRSDDATLINEWRTGDRPYYLIENRAFYEEYFSLFNKNKVSDNTIIVTDYRPVYAYAYLYFLPGLGITIGRVLSLGSLWTLLLGRFFNLILFVGSVFFVLNKIPVGKTIVFIWALLPMTLQQAASFSYDVPILTLSVIVISLSLKIAYSSEGTTSKIDDTLLFICTILLAPTKSLAITPLCLLPLIILFKKKQNKTYILSMMATMVLVVVLFNINPIHNLLSVGSNRISASNRGYELGYLLKNPKSTFLILCNTVYKTWDFIFETFIGNYLGHFEIMLPLHIVISFFIMLLLAGVKKGGELQYFDKTVRLFFLVIALLGYAFASGGMLLGWTEKGLQYIDGVQGRYLLPFAILAFLSLRSDKLVADKSLDNHLVFNTVWLDVYAVFCIYRFFI